MTDVVSAGAEGTSEARSRLRQIVQTFDDEAAEWDELARRYQTRYDEMVRDLLSRLRIAHGARVLDLGSGSGGVAEMLLERHPAARVTLLDLSSNMLEVAERRLRRFSPRASFIQGAFEDMPPGPFDAVMSTLALHHIGTDDEKRAQYARIHDALTPGGCFWQGEYVLASSPEDSALNEDAWVGWLRTLQFSEDGIEALRERVRVNDRPASLAAQMQWLGELGFVRVDCTWRYIKFAVFGGWKPPEPPEPRKARR
jgi:tRNA (cmo5U34)-methyltransferase